MRAGLLIFAGMIVAASPTSAQEIQKPSVTDQQRKSVGDEKAAEIRALIEKARIRQQGVDRQNENLWARWTYAVCIGCGPVSGKIRMVRTNPLRVLMGIPAAEDDARGERGKQRI
ncbi:hypothetical protein MKK55_07465 [Methylobacterium sp. J-059]|uniref:hypothetical protein n=1 Tax=Methylobacterium sp. J-059 TaxID=2836643 RepID=UPI001FB96661|nr:hypothetical protein [Methylobacterium sp. J-059]MCJ2038793.1 hypothetical protein [Methylobacterium sp. J-059]